MARQLESKIQQACVSWFRMQPKYRALRRLLFAVPNGAFLQGNKVERAKRWKWLEKEGAVSGVADMILLVPSGDYAGLCIEMKTPTGRQTDSQKAFGTDVERVGFAYVVCRSLDQFMELVTEYLESGVIRETHAKQ